MDTQNYKSLMEKTLKHLEQEFAGFQLGRASSGLVENIDVFIPSRGMTQKVAQVGNVTIMDAQTIKIEPWDKGTISSIEKGIYDSGIGLTPVNQGTYIMIKIPPLTQERRKDLAKMVSKMTEEAKIAIRNIRHDATKEIKTEFEAKLISEDQKKNLELEIDEFVKQYNTKIDTEAKNKSEEIMKI